MRLVIAAVGRLKAGPERELADRYRERAISAGRAVGLRTLEVLEVEQSRARRAPARVAEENLALAASLPENAVIVALDAGGAGLSSTDFAARLGRWRDQALPATA